MSVFSSISCGAAYCAVPPVILTALRRAGMAMLLAAPWVEMPAASAAEATDVLVARSARQFLLAEAERNGWLNAKVDVTVTTPTRALPACRTPPSVSPVDTRYPARMRFVATCADDNWQRDFVVRAEISADVVVAATAIPANRTIARGDITVEHRSISTMPNALSDPDEATGHSSQRPLRPGQVLQKSWLSTPILFKRGAPVRIVARSGPIDVSTSGEALEAGRLDEVVQVRNVASGKVIRARVIDSATVEPVDLPMTPHSRD